MSRIGRAAAQLVAGICGIAAVTLACVRWLDVTNAATISASFLLVVLVVAATSPFWIAALTSLTAVLSFNYFFLPPVQTLTIADPQNWVALTAFLAVSLVASNLSAVARAKREEAEARRRELVRLVDLSRDVLVMGDAAGAMTELARSIARRFDLAFVAIALPSGDGWHVFEGGAAMTTIDRDAIQFRAAPSHES